MFLNDLYYIHQRELLEPTHGRYLISFNSNHPIFSAHFPNRPIVPGVCSVEIIREIVSDMLGASYDIQEIKNLKFTELIIPKESQRCLFDVVLIPNGATCSVKSTITSEDALHCYTKLSMILTSNRL